jgi:hypothetical protein
MFAFASALLTLESFAADDPVTLFSAQDTTLRPDKAGDPGKDPGSELDLMVYGPKHSAKDFRALIQFDTKDLPKQPVLLAVLKLTIYKCFAVRKTKQDIIRVHRMVRPWGEFTASWGRSIDHDEWINPGGDFDPVPAAATPIPDEIQGEASGKTIDFDVTPLVQAWQSGQPNCGLILINADNDSATTFRCYSKNDKTEGNRPQLTIYFATPPKRDVNWIKPTTLKPIGNAVQMRIQLDSSMRRGETGVKYSDMLKAKGGIAPYSFKVQGDLPEGLVLAPDGALTGTPAKGGKFPVTVFITDAGKRSASAKLTLEVVEKPVAEKKPQVKKPDEKEKKPTVEEE